ncbi:MULTISPECIES: YitT family protein [Shouchella]|uniref:YitT family protein n=2 Tax=Bacillaceae TaxID=186817 RepID=A0A060LVI3_9BACI|nr:MULTISPECIES: YitT family protein [Bacillaceae]AIC95271.1 hypothetical protein BleG1_2706 [Shouchella lehensis G1]KQL57501.1 hypothetical protein AN965_08325 [Alkalicoccobacillus plakortidis]RQW21085.1 YitT family protein [Bacillus sp. C1-1]
MNVFRKAIAILTGCFIVSIGVLLLRHAGLITGGTAGLTLTISYVVNLPFSLLFFLVNIPFYVFSFIRMGLRFTIVTILSVTFLSLLTAVDTFLPSFTVPMFFGAVLGGVSIGVGLTLLFNHQASLGGANILALYLQRKMGIDPGKTNFLFDGIVVLLSFLVVGMIPGLFSILSIVLTSKIISLYKHRFVKPVKLQKASVSGAGA